ncbi:unnamed protein product [Gordionus sp. m RMFG-2023]
MENRQSPKQLKESIRKLRNHIKSKYNNPKLVSLTTTHNPNSNLYLPIDLSIKTAMISACISRFHQKIKQIFPTSYTSILGNRKRLNITKEESGRKVRSHIKSKKPKPIVALVPTPQSINLNKPFPIDISTKTARMRACAARFRLKLKQIFPTTYTSILKNRSNLTHFNTNDIHLITEHTCGPMNIICQFCFSMNFIAERPTDGKFTQCCHKGKVILTQIPYPPYLKNLISNPQDKLHNNFMKNIRSYNSAVAFASMGAKISDLTGSGPYCFKVHGQIYHRTSNLYPPSNALPTYAQLYVLDTTQAIDKRIHHPANSKCNKDIMKQLDQLIRQINPYALSFKTLGEVHQSALELATTSNTKLPTINMIFKGDRSSDRRRYNLPSMDDVAMIFNNEDGEPPFKRDIKVYPKSNDNDLIILNVLSPNLDPMVYPILFPHGEPGWSPNMIADNSD